MISNILTDIDVNYGFSCIFFGSIMHTMKYIMCNPQVCVLSACCLPKPYLKLVGAGLEEKVIT